jgi:K+-sensing histidine kinase KdpD
VVLGRAAPAETGRPWFRLRPAEAVAVAAGLFVAISVLQWFVDGSGQAVVMLYLLPVALLSVTFGLRGGSASAAIAFGVFAVFEVFHSSGDIDVEGWIVRGLALFLLGGLLGRATDEMEASKRTALEEQRGRCLLEAAIRRYTDAIEISDSILQQLVAAKWLAEAGRSDQVVDLLDDTIVRGEHMVAGLLTRRARPEAQRAGAS